MVLFAFLAFFCELWSTTALKKSPSNTRQTSLLKLNIPGNPNGECATNTAVSKPHIYLCVCPHTNWNVKVYHLTGLLYSPRNRIQSGFSSLKQYTRAALLESNQEDPHGENLSGGAVWCKGRSKEELRCWAQVLSPRLSSLDSPVCRGYLEPSPLLRA